MSTAISPPRRTCIVATIGPACEDEATLRAMLGAGMDVARLNFSHGTHATHALVIERLRRIAGESDRPLAILQDLQGPKMRLGPVPGTGRPIAPGDTLLLTVDPAVTSPAPSFPRKRESSGGNALPVQYAPLAREVRPGGTILIDDGRIEVRVRATDDPLITCEVVRGGILRSFKGLNLPGATLSAPTLTAKDRADAAWGIAHGVDAIALSFVRSPSDIAALRALVRSQPAPAGDPLILAKLEKHEAVESFADVLAMADGIMVARGDLGVELPAPQVPLLQKRFIAAANAAGKPVITATQMLESMTEEPQPTRAEVSDVANAVFDGTDAIMLSGETAVGRYPVEAVRMMDAIARTAEQPRSGRERRRWSTPGVTDAIAGVSVELAEELAASAIICATTSGHTARMVARYRPATRIVAATHDATVWRQLAFTWGVTQLLGAEIDSTDELIEARIALAQQAGVVTTGDLVVIVAGVPVSQPGTTNMVKVHRVGDPVRLG